MTASEIEGLKILAIATPVLVVGTYDKDGKPNVMTVAWGGICCSRPPCVAVSMRKATYSYGNIVERKAFTISVPSETHARETARVINAMEPDFLRLRTLVPKINTPLLEEVLAGRFQMLSPHGVLRETLALIEGITVATQVVSDHYTNYLNVSGRLPEEKEAMVGNLKRALERDEGTFRPFFIGTE